MTGFAFVRQTKCARRITKEVIGSSGQLLITAIANAVAGLGAAIFSHARECGELPPLFQLPWKEYPGTK
jgi:hypothetical protein